MAKRERKSTSALPSTGRSKTRTWDEISGIAGNPSGKVATLAEIDAAIAEGWTSRYKRYLDQDKDEA